MQQSLGEHEEVAHLQGHGEQLAVGVDEAHVHGALHHSDHLRRPGVGVGWHQTALGIVELGQRESERVQTRVVDGGESRCEANAQRVVGGRVGTEPGEREVGRRLRPRLLAGQSIERKCLRVLQIRRAVVIDRIGVAGYDTRHEDRSYKNSEHELGRHLCRIEQTNSANPKLHDNKH